MNDSCRVIFVVSASEGKIVREETEEWKFAG
jgi:hypothetical protein